MITLQASNYRIIICVLTQYNSHPEENGNLKRNVIPKIELSAHILLGTCGNQMWTCAMEDYTEIENKMRNRNISMEDM